MSYRILFLFALVIIGGGISLNNIKPFYIYEQSPKLLKRGLNRFDIDRNGEKLILRKFLKPKMVVFDIGAKEGGWSRCALDVEPEIELYSFEPFFHMFVELTKMENLSAFNIAFGDRDVFFKKPISLQFQKLDTFCEAKKISKIDFLKIDAKGAEWSVLAGAKKMIQDQKISAIQFEYNRSYLEKNLTLKKVMGYLTEHGYLIFRIFPKGLVHLNLWEDAIENYQYSNYLAVLKEQFPEYLLMDFSVEENL